MAINEYIEGDFNVTEIKDAQGIITSRIKSLIQSAPATLPPLNITAGASPSFMINTPFSFEIDTILPDGDYSIPYHAKGDTKVYKKKVSIALGVGTVSFNFISSGEYYILNDELKQIDLQVNGASVNEFRVDVTA